MTLYKYLWVYILFIFTSISSAAEYVLPNNQWRMISLPGSPGSASTVKEIFGDDMVNAEYGTDGAWILFSYNAVINSYQVVEYETALEQGRGYWVIQTTGIDVTLDMPENNSVTNSFTINLTVPQDGQTHRWNLVGNPFSIAQTLADFSVKTDQNICSNQVCSLYKADENRIVQNVFWHYTGREYKKIESETELNAWEGFWCVTLEKSKGLNLLSLIVGDNPEPSSGLFPVYNHAYQENFSADKLSEIIINARNAYVLLDPFEENVFTKISEIKNNNNQVSGYISAGTGENWRIDYDQILPYLSTIPWEQWGGEYFVSQTTTGILDVMKARIDKMSSWGLDWVEFDNMDWLDEDSRSTYQLEATIQESQEYINKLCDYTHSKGMKCMAKNTVDGFEGFDGVTYESYNRDKNWWDEQGAKNFLGSGKLVIINHYNENDCDGIYRYYKDAYNSENISFICEDRGLKKYKHYNLGQ